MDFECLISFNCTLKIHYAGGGRQPVQHSCKFSLGAVNRTQPCFLIEGSGIGKPRRMKFSSSDLHTIAAARISEGRLSITVNNREWQTIALSEVRDRRSLAHLHELLESIFNGSFPKGAHGLSGRGQLSSAGKTPPPSLMVNRRSPSRGSCDQSSGKTRRLYSLSTNPSNWRGASMVAAAQANKKTTPSLTPSNKPNSFYGSTPPTDSLVSPHPGRGERSGFKVQDRSGGKYFNPNPKSVRRTLDMGEQTFTSDSDDFQPTPNYRVPRDSAHQSQRPPLGTLSTVPQGNVAKGNGKLEQLLRADTDPDGLANLGNTCYMNAVLQSLLGLYPFAEDLLDPHLLKSVHPRSLYRMMVLLLKCKRSKDSVEAQRILLKKIKAAISTNTPKFVGFRQQDAHELLSQCLDQLKEDVEHVGNHGNVESTGDESANVASPVVMNFESSVEHRIVCRECGLVTSKTQLNYDFPLQLPKKVLHKHNEQANLQQQFDQFFSEEEVEFNCTRCKCSRAKFSNRLAKLPRILILHLKRYGYNCELSANSKRVDNIRIPRYINVAHLTKKQCELPPFFTGPNSRDSQALSAVLVQSEEKENMPSTNTEAVTDQESVNSQQAINVAPRLTTQSRTPVLEENDGGLVSKYFQTSSALASHTSHTITSHTPHTPPSHTPHTPTSHTPHTPTSHTPHTHTMTNQREDAIVISDSEDESVGQKSEDKICARENLCTNTVSMETALSNHSTSTSSGHHGLSTHDRSTTLSDKEGTTLRDGLHPPSAMVSDYTSLLGKRKSSERNPSSSDLGDLEGSILHAHTCTNGVSIETNHSQANNDVDILSYCDQDYSSTKYAKSIENEDPIQTNHQSHSSNTGAEFKGHLSQTTNEEAQDKSLEEIDQMLATVPLEELMDFPLVRDEDDNVQTSTTSCQTISSPLRNGNGSFDVCKSSFLNQQLSHEPSLTTSERHTGNTALAKAPVLTNGLLQVTAPPEVKGEEVCKTDSSNGVSGHGMSPGYDFKQEQEDFQRAVEESLKTQPSEFHLEGLSEEDQLRLALELSIQESLPVESQATPTSSPCPGDTTLQRIHTTPTPEKNSHEAYRLVSIVNHIGRGTAGGHYISDVYSFPDHSWRTYNDTHVSEIREEDVRQRRQTTGYIFFYMHRSIFTRVSAHFGR